MSAPASDERHLELKVGAMILVALVLLVGFVLVLGDWSWTAKRELDVHFQNPGGLSPGASVKVAGRKAGTITEMSYIGQDGPINPATQKPALVRVRISIDEMIFEHLREDVRFYITTKGVLGDPYLEIDPGTSEVALDKSTSVFGVDPPRLDLMIQDGYRLVRNLTLLIERNSDNIDKLLGDSAKISGVVADLIEDDDAGPGEQIMRLDRILAGTESLLTETRELVVTTKKKYVDDPKIERSIANVESITRKVNRDLDPLLADVRQALAVIERLGETIGPAEQKKIKNSLSKLESVASRANRMMADVDGIIKRVKRGEGTVGQLMADEEIYDDLKELIRDIKRNPWKIIWQD